MHPSTPYIIPICNKRVVLVRLQIQSSVYQRTCSNQMTRLDLTVWTWKALGPFGTTFLTTKLFFSGLSVDNCCFSSVDDDRSAKIHSPSTLIRFLAASSLTHSSRRRLVRTRVRRLGRKMPARVRMGDWYTMCSPSCRCCALLPSLRNGEKGSA